MATNHLALLAARASLEVRPARMVGRRTAESLPVRAGAVPQEAASPVGRTAVVRRAARRMLAASPADPVVPAAEPTAGRAVAPTAAERRTAGIRNRQRALRRRGFRRRGLRLATGGATGA